jgi:hypothetical protein
MTRIHAHKLTFSGGEVGPRLYGRGDLRAYANGASRLRNVIVHPTGGVSRRPGFYFIDEIAEGPGRLAAFEFNTEQSYLLVFVDLCLKIYRNVPAAPGQPAGAVFDAQVATPWTLAQLDQLSWVQTADTLLVVHPDVPPRQVTRVGASAWQLTPWSYAVSDDVEDRLEQPYVSYAFGTPPLFTPSGQSGAITVTSSANYFVPDHDGLRFRLRGRELLCTGFVDAMTISAQTIDELEDDDLDGTTDFEEQAFSALRGWPASVALHQDRLVIGGGRDLPNHVWMSKSSDLFNFDLGEGLDDEGIHFSVLSDQVNAIRAIFSGRHLQVLTSGAEWMVTGDPLTPKTVQLRRQTRVGSVTERRIPPRDVDGATLFVARGGEQLREFLFTDVEQAYQAGDLTLLAPQMINDAQDIAYDPARRLVFVVNGDGSLASLTQYRAEEVSAWSLHTTEGAFRRIAAVEGNVFALVEREGGFFLELLDPELRMDSALAGEAAEPTAVWAGLDHLEGQQVQVVADGRYLGELEVIGGAVTLEQPAASVVAGLGYAHEIAPLPPVVTGTGGIDFSAKVRLIEAAFRLEASAALRVDTGQGYRDLPFQRLGEELLDRPPEIFSGDKTLRALGWRPGSEPLWRVAGDAPLPLNLLSVTTEMKVSR